VILANPPYSIKSWDQKNFANDPYGRNLWGVPPQGCADYAFQQHIQKSLDDENGRSISLWPHGVLFRDSEAAMRRKMIEDDLVECVIGLGPNLFYNSSMVSCLLITNNNKPASKKGKIQFIQAVDEVRKEKTMSYLDDKHIHRIHESFKDFSDINGFSAIVSNEKVLEDKYARLSIQFYVKTKTENEYEFSEIYKDWKKSSRNLKESMEQLFKTLENE
jgi:type I restriction enzyme M protein